jgi:tRNA-dihydrouridine synthase B
MERGFWEHLPRPILGLSPMDGVTDAAYRFMVAKYGKPSVMMTEFTAAEGIRAGAERLMTDFLYDPIERPVVAQIFGSDPSAFIIAGAVAAALGFDGVDINMGCPAKNIAEKGAGASLILDPHRAKAIIRATREGIKAYADGKSLKEMGVLPNIITIIEARRTELGLTDADRRDLPVSVKTRIGYSDIVIEEWVKHLLEEKPVAITLHGRTLKQLYTGFADWDAIARGAAIIHETDTLVLGNGDVQTLEEAQQKVAEYGVDGVLIGRASFGNPWLFAGHDATWEERKSIMLEHARYLNTIVDGRGFIRMRKHLLDYTRGFEGAKETRMQLMRVTTLAEVEAILLN